VPEREYELLSKSFMRVYFLFELAIVWIPDLWVAETVYVYSCALGYGLRLHVYRKGEYD
jgi:hypothetical protein